MAKRYAVVHILYGQTHAVVGQYGPEATPTSVSTVCHRHLTLETKSRGRFRLVKDQEETQITCHSCRTSLGLDEENEENVRSGVVRKGKGTVKSQTAAVTSIADRMRGNIT